MKKIINNIMPRIKNKGLFIQSVSLFAIFLFFASCNNNAKISKTDFSKSESISDSITLITKALKKDSSDFILWKKRADLYMRKGNIDAAFRDLNSALELNNKDPQLFSLLADIYFAIGKKDESLSAIKKAIELSPKDPSLYLKMAKFKLMLGKFKSASAFADKVISLDPENAQAFYVKAVSSLEQKDSTTALEMIMIATNIDTDFFAANLNAAVLLDKNNDTLAEKFYKKALRNKPDNLMTAYSLAMYYQKHGKFSKALETYNNITKAHPSYAHSYFNAGYIYLTEYMNYKKAEEMFEKAIEANPDYTEAVYNLGRTYEAMGDTIKAINKYKESLKLKTNYPLAIEGLTRLEK